MWQGRFVACVAVLPGIHLYGLKKSRIYVSVMEFKQMYLNVIIYVSDCPEGMGLLIL
jgi:hypothetical protein